MQMTHPLHFNFVSGSLLQAPRYTLKAFVFRQTAIVSQYTPTIQRNTTPNKDNEQNEGIKKNRSMQIYVCKQSLNYGVTKAAA